MSIVERTDKFMIRNVAEKMPDGSTRTGRWAFYQCPRCSDVHALTLDYKNAWDVRWDWNGDIEKPTVSPSVFRKFSGVGDVCHHTLRDGKVTFAEDTTNLGSQKFAGLTFDLPLLPNYWRE